MAARSGRRPGNQDTRQAILHAAREIFADHGYDGASIRQIAASAKVDPALIHHYFGTKEKLFLEVVQPPVDPSEMVPQIFAHGHSALGERIARTFLSVWENPARRPGFEALLRGAISSKMSARLVREFFTTQIQRRLAKELTSVAPAEVPIRASLIASQLFGLALTRYILKIEPLASSEPELVVALIGPTIDRYLHVELPT